MEPDKKLATIIYAVVVVVLSASMTMGGYLLL